MVEVEEINDIEEKEEHKKVDMPIYIQNFINNHLKELIQIYIKIKIWTFLFSLI